jgi:hypothetical protein
MKYVVTDDFVAAHGWTPDKTAKALLEPLARIGVGIGLSTSPLPLWLDAGGGIGQPCSYNPLPRSVAATDVGHTPIVSADGHVAATRIAVVSVPTTVPIPPVVTIPITTDTRRTDAELAARKHNWLIGRTHRARKRRQGRETARKHQD